ncbi:hypothetical protein HPB47_005941 [Ixodes persulcatus]|uniref:Uncharacterized protein n=1 Tax=Ixodes persulcatus TaxID=34615 RepID=A0AC60PBK2_IXOPE|nr:hypothetical protein HPB47_005941 [Ixodes persulcatus]
MQKQQQQVPQTPPRAPTPLPEDLKQKIEYRMNKLDERIDQKIDQTMSQMTEAMGKMGDEHNQRISDVEKEREEARKKPKPSPGGDALTKEAIITHNGEKRDGQERRSRNPQNLALQETETDTIKIRGYETHISEGRNRTAILTKKQHTTEQHQISHRIEHTLIEMTPQKKTVQSLFILNVYSPPSDNLRDLDKFLRDVKKVTKGQKLLVVWDFDAPHVAWEYHKPTRRARMCTTRLSTSN